MFLVKIFARLQLTMIKLHDAITKGTIQIFHSHFCLILCASFKKRKGFTETQAYKRWLKILVDLIFWPYEG